MRSGHRAATHAIVFCRLASAAQNRHHSAILWSHCRSTNTSQATREVEMTNRGHDQLAEALVFVHGARAEAEAARHEILCATSGDRETAETWREVQIALRQQTCKKAA